MKIKHWVYVTIFLAFLIRVVGVYPGYPKIHPDEVISYHTATYMLYHYLKPDIFFYPAGVPFIHAVIYAAFFIPSMMLKIFITNPINMIELFINPADFFLQYKDAIFGPIEINAMYWSRYIAATFGTLTVLFVYLTAKRLFNKETGLFAAFFLAVNYRHVLGSHFGLPDVHNAFFAMLTLYASILLLEKNTRKRYLFAALSLGLTLAMKYQVFAFLPFLMVHVIWAFRQRNLFYLINKDFLLAMAVFIVSFFAVNPYLLFNLPEFLKQGELVSRTYQMGILRFRVYPYFYLFNWGIGMLPSLTIVLGILVMIKKEFQKFMIIASFAFTVLFIMTIYSNGGIYGRNYMSFIPYFTIFAGYFTYMLYLLIRKFNSSHSLIITMLFVIIVNLSSMRNSFILSYQYSMPWTSTTLAKWMETSFPQDTTLQRYSLFLPPSTVDYLNKKNIKQIDWDYQKFPNSLAEFQNEGVDFTILNTFSYQSIIYWWRQWPGLLYFKYQNVPFDFIENTYQGLIVKELLQYTVKEIYKPWQAQETSNYLVFKIPQRPSDAGRRIAQFRFSSKGDMWKIRESIIGPNPSHPSWNAKEGKESKGSMMIKFDNIVDWGFGVNTSRFSSYPIAVSPNKLYTILGWIKNDLNNRPEHDGFLRLDFYTSVNRKEIQRIGSAVSVSDRAPASGKWAQVRASAIAPQNAKFATISFQTKEFILYPSFVDDVEFYESDQIPQERFKELPYSKSTIPKESLYYNSFL